MTTRPALSAAGSSHPANAAPPPIGAADVPPWAAPALGFGIVVGLILSLVGLLGAQAAGLGLLSVLAVVGVFCCFGLMAGYVRLDAGAPEATLERLVAHEADGAMELATTDGLPVYANRSAVLLRGRRAPSIDALLSANAATVDAAYRLSAAAVRAETRTEDVRLPAGTAGRDARWLRIAVRPFALPAHLSDDRRLVLWTASDVTSDKTRALAEVERLQKALSFFDHMPVGVTTLDAAGNIGVMNEGLRAMLRLATDAPAPTQLTDILSKDAAALFVGAAGADAAQRHDVDLVRDDGSALPVHVLVTAPAATAPRTIIVLERRTLVSGHGTAAADIDDRFARVLNAAPFGIATIDHSGAVVNANAAFARLFPDKDAAGVTRSIVRRLAGSAAAEQKAAVEQAIVRALAGRLSTQPIDVGLEKDAALARRLYVNPLTSGVDPREAAIIYATDLSEQKALEQKFAKSQKMEAIGSLAGGIAHDFNNVLQVIIGFSDLMLQKQRPTDPGYREFMDIRSYAQRAAGMVRQLLAFSRKQTLEPETINVNDVLQDFAVTYKKTIGETVEVRHVPTRHLWPIRADRTQLDQVLLNLAVNARDAMPKGGSLSFRSKNVTERESLKFGGTGMTAGEYVLIEVEDTGTGMSADVLNRIFEPYFTTKDVGKGTGLGLSTVFGIVKQTGGFIYADSTVGKGTTFRIFLPRHIPTEAEEDAARAAAETKKKETVRDLTGTGRVLLVEDDDGVRSFAVMALQRQGYEVLEAISGAEALEVLDEAGGKVDVVVSDVVMPEMDGPTMYKEILKIRPDMPIIFVSGYPRDHFDNGLDPNAPASFLPKPFTLPQLAAKVKEVLGG